MSEIGKKKNKEKDEAKDKKNWEPLQEFIVDESFSLLQNGVKYFLDIDKDNIPANIQYDFLDNISKAVGNFIKNLLQQ
jgi:hypothetical protein